MIRSARKLKLLIAEDDPDDRLLLEEAMQEVEGDHSVVFSSDGEALLQHLRETNALPDLILLDLNMPRMNGFEALIELKRSPRLQAIPVIILTTSTAVDDIHRSYELGVHSFFAKPESFRELVEMFRCLVAYWSGVQPPPSGER